MPICTKINGKLIEIDPKVQYEGITQTPAAVYAKINGEIRELWSINDTDDISYVQVFTETTTVTVPKGATAALISGCGAGSANYAGASVLNWYTPVTEGEEIVCTVGKTGETGGDSSFGSYIALGGGSTSAEGAVNICRNLSSGAETPFGKSNTSGYGAAGRDGLIAVKWITIETGVIFTDSQNFVVPENVTGVLVSGCAAGGNAFVDTAMGGSVGGTGSSVISYYTPVSTTDSIQCTVGFGYHSYSESAGDSSQIKDTKFGNIVVLGGGKNAPAWNEKGDNGIVYCATNFSDYASFGDTGRLGVTPWGKEGSYPSEGVGYGISGTDNPNLMMNGRPGLLILEYVNNKDTIVLTESQTITVPLGVTGALISGCGAGGGKISLTRAPAPDSTGASGAGGSIINYYIPLSAGESIECIIGEANTSFGDGGDTKFGNYITLGGGKITSATGSVPSGVNLSKDAFVSDGGYTPFGRTSYYDSTSTYHEAMGYGAGSNGYEVGEPSSSLPGLLIIQWVK